MAAGTKKSADWLLTNGKDQRELKKDEKSDDLVGLSLKESVCHCLSLLEKTSSENGCFMLFLTSSPRLRILVSAAAAGLWP